MCTILSTNATPFNRLLDNEATKSSIMEKEESVRKQIDDMAWDHTKRYRLFQNLVGLLEPRPSLQSYLPILEAASIAGLPVDETSIQGSFRNGSTLYFHGAFDSEGNLTMRTPEMAYDRRLYRKFGSHRFLHIDVPKEVLREKRESFFGSSKSLFGRHWSLLWCQMAKCPQRYVLFAEKGVGIRPEEERSVTQLHEWCIPRRLNSGITIGKFYKRLKLSYSQTASAGLLPRGSVELLPDLGIAGKVVDIDGQGLVSKEGLDFIWRNIELSKASSDLDIDLTNSSCPNTGFQGRLGGFKGAWLLDASLGEGIKFQCRKSQHKYRLPQKCLVSTWEDGNVDGYYDPLYDTIEVCSWDTKPALPAALNSRLIQMLESSGVSDELFLKWVDDSTQGISCLTEDVKRLARRYTEMVQKPNQVSSAEHTDSCMILRMLLSKVSDDEPNFVDRRERLVRNEIKRMRLKVSLQIYQPAGWENPSRLSHGGFS
jgi:hypothetical protein